METKIFAGDVEFKSTPQGQFTALVSTFNTPDRYGDVVKPGAFSATIARWRSSGGRIPVVFSHRSENPEMFIGHVDPEDLRETGRGLEATGTIDLQDAIGRKVFAQLQRKTLSEWSYAYTVTDSRRSTNGRELLALELFELGPCLVGVGSTQTLATKAATRETPRALTPAEAAIVDARRRFALNCVR